MDITPVVAEVVEHATKLRNGDYENVSDGAELSLFLAEACDAVAIHVRDGGSVPDDTMPWDGGNHESVKGLIAAVYADISEERMAHIFASGILLSHLITMIDVPATV